MPADTVYIIPFDIEILIDGVSYIDLDGSKRYINRGTSLSSPHVTSNSRPLYCLPNISFRFDIDAMLEQSNAEQDDENFTYVFSKQYITWDFGDGTVSQEYRPIHKYTAPGTYTISVTLFEDTVILIGGYP